MTSQLDSYEFLLICFDEFIVDLSQLIILEISNIYYKLFMINDGSRMFYVLCYTEVILISDTYCILTSFVYPMNSFPFTKSH